MTVRFTKEMLSTLDRKPFVFDLCVFIGLTVLMFIAIVAKACITNEAIVDESDLESLTVSTFISAVFVIPFIEEFVFRGYLCLEKRIYIVLFAIAAVFAAYSFFGENVFIVIAIVLFAAAIFFFKKVRDAVNRFIHAHLLLFILVSSTLFGTLHLMNYEHFEFVLLLAIVPKVLKGIFLSYITLKYNIFLGIMDIF